MLLSVGIQLGSKIHPSNLSLTKIPFPPQKQISPLLRTPSFSLISRNKLKPKPIQIPASSFSPTIEESIPDDRDETNDRRKKKRRVVVKLKPLERPRLVLRFIWMEKNIGIALDQVIPGGHGTIPLSPYYFWPRKDAWEEIKVMLESKPWISGKQVVVLLNQATDIINLWQQNGGGD